MGDLYKRLAALCDERGISGYRMCKDVGIQPSIMTDLKMGRRSSVKAETADRIANYFGVSVGYLLGNEKEPATDSDGFTPAERRDIAKEVERMMADLEHQGDLMFDGDPATPEALESIRTAFMIGLTHARKLNKQGKKYKPPEED